MQDTKFELKSRQLRLFEGYCMEDTAEQEDKYRALGKERISVQNRTCAKQQKLLENIASPGNLLNAFKQVKRNKGAAGIDHVDIKSFEAWFQDHIFDLSKSIVERTYEPQAVRRVEIPKDNGDVRKLGIPTVCDRVVQQAIAQVLIPIYEPKFVNTSYGFRPGLSAHDALYKCQEYLNQGRIWTVDMDLEKFFDTVNHSKLVQVLSREIYDGRVISLIHKYLNAGVMVSGTYNPTEIGVPQGGPLSPILANVILDDLDKELQRRGHRFVRYADDMVIFCKSKRAAQRTLDKIVPFIEDKLLLKVNRDKTVVAYAGSIKFLGYGFYKTRNGYKFRVSKKSKQKMKACVKELIHRHNFIGYKKTRERLNSFIRGWINYYKLADMRKFLKGIDAWMRRRIRKIIWIMWKKPSTRYRYLTKLGVSHQLALNTISSGKGSWRIAASQALQYALTDERLERRGYLFFSSYYKKVVTA